MSIPYFIPRVWKSLEEVKAMFPSKEGKMTKTYKRDKEFDKMDKMKHEIKCLKRDLKAARKMLDRYLVAEQSGLFDGEKVIPSKKRKEKDSIYEKWMCHTCENGTLELVIFGKFYLRKCNGCGKMTKRQEVKNDLNGVLPGGGIYKEEK